MAMTKAEQDALKAQVANSGMTQQQKNNAYGQIAVGNTPVFTSTPTTPKKYEAPSTVISNASSGSSSTQSAQQKRVEEGKYAVYSTIPEVASLQRQSRAIYETTGKWNTPEQTALNNKAEQIRKGLNPNYSGGGLGFNDGQYFLPGAGNATPTLDGAGQLIDSGLGGAVGAVSAITGSATGMIAIAVVALLFLGRK